MWDVLVGTAPTGPLLVDDSGHTALRLPSRRRRHIMRRTGAPRLPADWDTAPTEAPRHPLFGPPTGQPPARLGASVDDPVWTWLRAHDRAAAAAIALRHLAGLGDDDIATTLRTATAVVAGSCRRLEAEAGAGEHRLGVDRLRSASVTLVRAWTPVPVSAAAPAGAEPSGGASPGGASPGGERHRPTKQTVLASSAIAAVLAVAAVVGLGTGGAGTAHRRAVPTASRSGATRPIRVSALPPDVPGVGVLPAAVLAPTGNRSSPAIPVLTPPYGRPVLQQLLCRIGDLAAGRATLGDTDGDTAVTLVDVGDRSCLLSAQPDAHLLVAGRSSPLPLLPSSAAARNSLLIVPIGGRIVLPLVVSADACPPNADPMVRPTLVIDLPGGSRRFVVRVGPARPCAVHAGLFAPAAT